MQPFIDSLRARAAVPVAVSLSSLLFILAGGLGWGWAAVSIAGAVGWAALWPRPQTSQPDRSDTQGRPPSAGPSMATLPITLLDALPDAAVILDTRGLIVAANGAARAISTVLPGRPFSHWIRVPELVEAVEAATRTGQQQSCLLRLYSPVERSLNAYVTPLNTTARAEPAGLIIVLRDLTEQEQLSRMRADFVANASHELRTPLAAIRGFVETLQGAARNDPVAQERFLGIMQTQAERMSRLIEDLLSLSRIEMHEHVAPTTRTDAVAVTREAVGALKSAAEQAGIGLYEKLPDVPLWVIADKEELSQVAHNLIQNAIKYGRKGGRVEVDMRHDDGQVRLAVSDDGIGIAPEHLPRLTERFYRANSKESRERGGTGLGLAIVKHIVNRHHGELRIESTLGKGSTFTVGLPPA